MKTIYYNLCVKLQMLLDENGQDLIEYVLVAAIIALGAVAGMSSVASSINNAFSTIGSNLTSSV